MTMGLDLLADIKAEVRAEAEKGARKAVTVPVLFAIGLALYALQEAKRGRRRR